MSKIVHFEIPVDDPDRAAAFYHDTLGWDLSRYGQEQYWMARAGADEEPGANGALVGREELHHAPVVIAGVDDLDAVLDRVASHGGQVLQGKQSIPGMGWSGYARDPEGNTIGFFEMDANAPATR